MDVWDLCTVMLRRWWVTLPCLALTAVVAALLVARLPTEYVSATSVALTVPPEPTQLTGPDGAPLTSGGVLAELLQGQATREAAQAAGGTGTYTLEATSNLVRVIASAGDPDDAVRTADAVLLAAEGEVTRREDAAGLPRTARTSVEILRRPGTAEPVAAGTASPGGRFQATGAVLLLPAAAPVANPVSASEFNALLLAEAVQGAPTRERIAAAGLLSSYEVKVDRDGPLLRLTVTGADAGQVTRTAEAVLGAMDEELSRRQEPFGVPPEQRVRTALIVPPENLSERTGSPVGSLIAVALLGLATTVALALLADRMAGRPRGTLPWPGRPGRSTAGTGRAGARQEAGAPAMADLAFDDGRRRTPSGRRP